MMGRHPARYAMLALALGCVPAPQAIAPPTHIKPIQWSDPATTARQLRNAAKRERRKATRRRG